MEFAFDTLRSESGNAIQELRRLLATAPTANAKTLKDFNFVNTKQFEGGKFAGGPKEAFETWAKKVKIHFNCQHLGLRYFHHLGQRHFHHLDQPHYQH